ncbi:MAG: hypothetical protein GY765_20760, partial [bacterium]|nr:hypothetical protein [bacterium]
NPTELGPWLIRAELTDGTTLISEAEMLFEVIEPLVSLETTAPQYAGDDPFPVKVKLINEGNIEAICQLNVSVANGGESKLEQTVTLKPLEEQVFGFNDTTAADRSYSVTLEGDVEKTAAFDVVYGIKETFAVNVQPTYREGQVSAGYQLSNSGALGFKDTVTAELYALGGTAPLYTFDRSYNLYPGETPITGNYEMQLAPGNYLLKYSAGKNPTQQETPFVVQPSGIGTVNLQDTGTLYPVGTSDINYSITNSDTVAGHLSVSITMAPIAAGGILTETRTYYLAPGETKKDPIHVDIAEKRD